MPYKDFSRAKLGPGAVSTAYCQQRGYQRALAASQERPPLRVSPWLPSAPALESPRNNARRPRARPALAPPGSSQTPKSDFANVRTIRAAARPLYIGCVERYLSHGGSYRHPSLALHLVNALIQPYHAGLEVSHLGQVQPHAVIEPAADGGQLPLHDATAHREQQCWLSVLRATFVRPMSDADHAAFAEVAGGRATPGKRVNELWCVCGRRSGKTRIAAAISVYIGAIAQHKLAPGEVGYVLLLAASRSQASVAFQYVVGFLESSPILRQQVESVTAEEVRLRGNIVIGVHAGSYRTIRGRSLLAVVGDETSFWRDIDSAQPDVEIFRACAPALAASGGIWIGISTGYRKLGLLYQKWRDHFGHDGDDVLVVQGPSSLFNPRLDLGMIERATAADPEAAESEWGGGFRSDIDAFLSDDVIERAIDHARPLELPPRNLRYTAFADPSGGRHDAFTLCIGHKEGESFVADVVRGTRAPFDPVEVARSYATLLKDYRLSKAFGDGYSAEWAVSAFKDCGIKYERADKNKSTLYLEALPLFTRGAIRIPDLPVLTRELRLLERQTHRSGRDTVDHGRHGMDDFVNALCGCAAYATGKGKYAYDTTLEWVG